ASHQPCRFLGASAQSSEYVLESGQNVLQELARQLSVEERNRGFHREIDVARQASVACEDKRGPARAPTVTDFAQGPVKRSEILFFSDALPVRRVAQKDPRRSIRRRKAADIFQLEANQVPDACRLGIADRKCNGIPANIRSQNWGSQFLSDVSACL